MAWERVVGAIGRARVPLPVVIAIVICAGLALWSARIESVASGAPPLRGPAITPAQNECDLEACKKWTECEPVAACPVSPPCPVAVPVICPTTAMVAAPLVTISPAYSVAPLAGTPRLLLDTISAVHDAANSQGAVQTVALTAGNAAMNLMIKNWAASIRRLQPPLPHLVVPLDNSGLEQLKSAIVPINLFQESAALSRFQAGGSNYGESIYAEMSAYKWRFALKLLEAGVPVLLADPDVVFLRNPVPYIIDVDYPSTGESIRAKNGWEYVGVRDFYCGGFAHLRPTVAGIAHLRYFLAQIDAMRLDDVKLEEQTVWNRMLTAQFDRVTPNVVDAIMARQCIEYKHKASDARITIWPLNPSMFPNYPIATKEKMPEHILEPPFILHFNWLYGIQAKMGYMQQQNMWAPDGFAV